MKILALSSSRAGSSGYLEPAVPLIKEISGGEIRKFAFIPFATTGSQQEYGEKVQEALKELDITIEMVTPQNGKELLNSCEGILTGGGNTFKLLHNLYQFDLLQLVRHRVLAGIPYVGWSAGSNILGLTISTTNDMPVIQPPTFEALALLPFHINPHYYQVKVEGFNGETRDDRISEFLALNPHARVIALPEGSGLVAASGKIIYRGAEPGYCFSSVAGQLKKEAVRDREVI